MRILQLSSARHFGGGERHLVDLIKGLIRKGHDIFVAITPDSPLLPELQDVPAGNIRQLPFQKPFDPGSAWELRRFARDQKIDVIHAHMARDYPIAALAARRTAPRLIITRHVLFPMGQFHRLTRRRVTRVIAVSEAVASSLRAQNIFSKDQIALVRHGIDLSRFQSVGRRTDSSVLRVGMVGELSANKGQADFVRAAAIIAAQRDDVEFVIAGRDNSAEEAYGRELKELIRSTGFGERIQLVESRVDVTDFLSRLDLFVSASRSEAFGLAIVEAMAAGVPVVATASDGAKEIITDSKTGRLTAIGDLDQLSSRIYELLNDSGERRRLAANARTLAVEKFSLERMIAETEAVYHGAIAGRPTGIKAAV